MENNVVMPCKLLEEFEGKEIAPLCIAANLSEANTLESILDNKQIDFTFEIAAFIGKFGAREGV